MRAEGWTLATVSEAFLSLEREMGLLEGPAARLWEASRFRIHQKLLASLGIMAEAQIQYRSIEKSAIKRALSYARNGLSRPALGTRKDAAFLVVGHSRRLKTPDGRWTDPYTDPLLERLGDDAAVVEPPHLGAHFTPPLVPGVRYLDDIELLGAVWVRVAQKRPSREVQAVVHGSAQQMGKMFGVDPGVGFEMTRAHELREGTLPLYDRLLARVRPKVVVLVVSYGKETLIEAARARSIPVIELQHGTVHPFHMGYTFPPSGKSTGPDFFLTFGRFWATSTSFSLAPERIRAVGFPAFDEARKKFTRRSSDQVLFVSQPAIGEPLSRMAVELRRKGGRPVVYKLHPGETSDWRSRLPWLVNSGVQVIDDPGISIYQLFQEAAVQVGVFSTALYEGMGFGVPTVVAQLPGSEACASLVSLGYARPASDVTELEAVVAAPGPSVDRELLFRDGALDRMITEVREIAG